MTALCQQKLTILTFLKNFNQTGLYLYQLVCIPIVGSLKGFGPCDGIRG